MARHGHSLLRDLHTPELLIDLRLKAETLTGGTVFVRGLAQWKSDIQTFEIVDEEGRATRIDLSESKKLHVTGLPVGRFRLKVDLSPSVDPDPFEFPFELEQAVIRCCGSRPRYLDEWIREYRKGIELLGIAEAERAGEGRLGNFPTGE